jgi:hypothetical protein
VTDTENDLRTLCDDLRAEVETLKAENERMRKACRRLLRIVDNSDIINSESLEMDLSNFLELRTALFTPVSPEQPPAVCPICHGSGKKMSGGLMVNCGCTRSKAND